MISWNYDKSLEYGRRMLSERYKTCGRCVYDSEGIFGPHCSMCKRNPMDNRIDQFKEAKE